MASARARGTWRRLRSGLARRLGVDPRALAAYRIAIAALVLVDLLFFRAPDLAAFYTDAGVLPRRLLGEVFPVAASLSVHTISGLLVGQVVLASLLGAAALALLVGYRTRLAALATWGLLASMHARNPHVVNAGDALVLATLFFGLFLPLGARWSIDALSRQRRTGTPRPVANAATAGLLLQVVAVYATNALFKLRSPRWMDGTAVAHVFALDDYTVLLGDVLAGHELLLVAANWLWLGTLVASPSLVLLTGRARAAMAGWLAAMHLGMAVTLVLGPFPFVSIAALLVFLPESAWDAVETTAAPLAARASGRLRSVFGPPTCGTASREPAAGLGPLANAAVAVLLVLGGAWHGMALGWIDEPDAIEQAGRLAEHRWSMFAPASTSYGWVSAPANLSGGELVDALQLAPYDGRPPDDLADAYPSTLWHRYLKDVDQLDDRQLAALAEHLCGRVADAYGEPVERVALQYVEHRVRLDGDDPVQRIDLHEQSCRRG